ncbi:MFS transporter [Bacillus benzoevorans]|uniref:AAHS family benzoate transporter-like MFS transporter n=1 Tax=Bacillus benzoevorans TaxID=1456 RepID=A0A7X0HQW0_9BACI|nr:MFS transporter [Bacillus benzoevorans]MBB6445275.1 AAHS family benzoate transporter-like MFS transporter [Bacillus benzoevorans]
MVKINPTAIITNSKFNKFHLSLLLWSLIIIIFDGYDIVIYGTVVPVLIEEWNLGPVEAGALGSYGLFGMMFGAILLGILADAIGRKKVIILSLFLFSLFTFLCGFADNPTIFSTYRFLAGLGLGGIMPNVIALLTDYAPVKIRSMIVSIVLCGYSIGGMLAPLLGIFAMPKYGWQSIFWFAGLPLLLLPLLHKMLPESANHLIKKEKKGQLLELLSKVNPDLIFDQQVEIEEVKQETPKVPVIGLFKESRALSTVMFWAAFFSCLLMIYGLNTWLPKLMMNAGYGLNSSLIFLITLQGGAIIGSLVIGRLCDKYGFKKMLIPLYTLGAVSLTLLGFGGNIVFIYVLVALAGASTIGAQNLIQAYVSQYYPPHTRSTALGMASGIGRMGGMMGPLLGGILLARALPIQLNFIAFAIPGIIAAIALSLVYKKAGHDDQQKRKNELTESTFQQNA